jgi:hypothetical protein
MENGNTTNILTVFTPPTASSFARYLTNDHIVIAGEKGCSILNLITQKETAINDCECVALAVYKNTKAIIPYIAKENTNQFYSYVAKIYDAQNINSIKEIGESSIGGPGPFDPSQQFIINDYPSIAAHYKTMMAYEKIGKVIFCPNEQFLTILLNYTVEGTDNSLIHYWDTITQLCVYSSFVHNSLLDRFVGIDLSFSPNEMKLLITFKHRQNTRCKIVSVPFIVRKKTPFAYWCLKNYQFNQQELPQDLINLIIATSLDI